MSISVNPILPVIAAQGAAPDLVLQPGSVVDAEVLKILSDDLVRIAIASLSIDVLSEIPLAAGQTLQLAVSQTPDGIRLAVVGQGAGSAASADTATLPPNAPVDAAAGPPLSAALPRNTLTPLEQVAVAAAAENAATQQDSLAPLFANLGVVAGSNSLPPKLQQAVMQVLVQQTSLDRNLTGSDVRNAVQKSGLFLEASLASGSVSLATGMPDLKAALIVLRQALVSSLGAAAATQNPATPVTAMPTPATAAPATVVPQPAVLGTPVISAGESAASEQVAAAPPLVPSLAPDIGAQEMLPPQARVPVVGESAGSNVTVRIVLPEALLNAGPRTLTAGAALNSAAGDDAAYAAHHGQRIIACGDAAKWAQRRRHLPYPNATAAISRGVALGATGGHAFDRPWRAARRYGASSARGYRRRDRAPDLAAGRLTAGSCRYPGRPD